MATDWFTVGRGEQASDGVHLIGDGRGEVAVEGERILCLAERVKHHPCQDRADGMELVFEGGDHAEVAAPTAQTPEEVGVLARARDQELAFSGNEIDGDEVVAGEAVLAARANQGHHPV